MYNPKFHADFENKGYFWWEQMFVTDVCTKSECILVPKSNFLGLLTFVAGFNKFFKIWIGAGDGYHGCALLSEQKIIFSKYFQNRMLKPNTSQWIIFNYCQNHDIFLILDPGSMPDILYKTNTARVVNLIFDPKWVVIPHPYSLAWAKLLLCQINYW